MSPKGFEGRDPQIAREEVLDKHPGVFLLGGKPKII